MKKAYLSVCMFLLFHCVQAQICATPGLDGPANVSSSINTYFPIPGDFVLTPGVKSMVLGAVPPNDPYGNNFGLKPISSGDLLLIIQMQDATINYINDRFYGGANQLSGPDLLGGTGFSSIGNSGVFEYVIATATVPLSGGTLTFKGLGAGQGTINTYVNAAATGTRGGRTFQVVRVPQYSNLTLSNDIKTPPFNGKAGGIIAFDVAGTMNFNGYLVDASARGFRGGYGPVGPSNFNVGNIYVIPSTDNRSTGKGEGLAGTPRYMWDGFNRVDNTFEGLPGGSYGRGAPANAGGGGNDHNAGGGGGGNAGSGGVGGNGVTIDPVKDIYPNGGRPGTAIYGSGLADLNRLIMGGGGGGGDANNAQDGVKGGVGGGIVLINAGKITGTGTILANGSKGAVGLFGSDPDGAGGGGAGGTVFLKVINPDPTARITITAKGGDGGNTERDEVRNHGPGGGGGGGQVFYNMPAASVLVNVDQGKGGLTQNGLNHGSADGQIGKSNAFITTDLPPYLQGSGSGCFPELTTVMSEATATQLKYPGNQVMYTIKTSNATGGGNAGGLKVTVELPTGISYKSVNFSYSGDIGGPQTVSNIGPDPRHPVFGDFNIPPGAVLTINLIATVDCTTAAGTYQSSAQASYLDPTRTLADPFRLITPFINAFPSAKTTYETGSAGNVAGSNYDGNLVVNTSEDVTVGTLTILNNTIRTPATTVFCLNGDPAPIIAEVATGGNTVLTYHWQQSADNVSFVDIPGQIGKDFDPGVIDESVYYRRMAVHDGCIQSNVSNVIFINVLKPLPTVAFDLPEICLRDASARFSNQTTISDGATTSLTYLWDFGDPNATPANPNTSTDRDGRHIYTEARNYNVKLTVYKSGSCPTLIEKTFTVNGSLPTAAFTVLDASACSGQEFSFEDQATVDFGEITKIEWHYDNSNDPAAIETDANPQNRAVSTPKVYKHVYPVFRSPASKTIDVRMVVYSGLSCSSEIIKTITLNAVPEVVFEAIAPVCEDAGAFQLTAAREIHQVLTGSGRYSGPGVTTAGVFDPALAGVGSHTISYIFTADNGCSSDVKTQTITVFPVPVVDAGRDQTILEGGEVQLNATATGTGLIYKWTPSVGLNRDDVLQPIATPTRSINYKLTVSTVNGCSSTDEVAVEVLRNPEIPNTFTPNGDNINDEWNIKYISSYPNATINIFNRYGEKVFSSTAGAKSWDGKYKGVDLPVGTYYYVIDPRNGRKIISGSLTILR